jgi:hypothetical protein
VLWRRIDALTLPQNTMASVLAIESNQLPMHFIRKMKHTDWLRLKTEGENICAVLRQQGYQCRKQTRRLSWRVLQDSHAYVLTWLPAPVGDWSLLPNDTSPVREKLMSVVQSALCAPKKETVMTYQPIQQLEDFTRPWMLVRLLPNAQRYTVARFYNRQDADDHKRVLHRFMPAAEFEVVFDVPDSFKRDDSELPK